MRLVCMTDGCLNVENVEDGSQVAFKCSFCRGVTL